MQHPRIIAAAVGVAVVAAVGGVAVAESGGSSSSSTATPTQSAPADMVRTMQASVAGQSETILIDATGMPLYYYQADTATSSAVSGALASAWPPVTGKTNPTTLAGGQLSSVQNQHGWQVTYNGHPLYTFVSDQPGMVTGQGVQNFFVATPNLAPLTGAPAPAPSSPPAYSGGYGY